MKRSFINLEEDEPELQTRFIKKIQKIKKQRSIQVDNFAKRYKI